VYREGYQRVEDAGNPHNALAEEYEDREHRNDYVEVCGARSY